MIFCFDSFFELIFFEERRRAAAESAAGEPGSQGAGVKGFVFGIHFFRGTNGEGDWAMAIEDNRSVD